MRRIHFNIQLNVRGPVLTKATSAGAFGVDAPMARGTFFNPASKVAEKRFYLSGRLLKGLLREAWQELGLRQPGYLSLIKRWLGDEAAPHTNEPDRGRLMFRDFVDWNTPAGDDVPVRYRIQIEEERGAAAGGMFQVLESPWAPGQQVAFNSILRAIAGPADTPAAIAELTKALQFGLNWIAAVGAQRSVSFGEVLSCTVSQTDQVCPQPSPSATPAGDFWHIRLGFTQPLILSKRKIADNLFESAVVVPGGAVVGAIATMTAPCDAEFAELRTELSRLHVSHAFPTPQGASRPAALPLSLVAFSRTDVQDVIRCVEPPDTPAPPAFDIDWKEDQGREIRRKFGWPTLDRELRVRTAIEGQERRASDTRLFGWQMVSPHGFEWVATVNVAALSPVARQQLAALLAFGLEPIGKSQALATVTLTGAQAPAVAPSADYIVTLQTPALLIRPDRFLAPDGTLGSSSQTLLKSEYEAVWRDLSGGALTLVNYFQRCSLAGGDYHRRRFKGENAPYRPWLLTDAGAVFLLRPAAGREAEAARVLEGLAGTGLPLTEQVSEFYQLGDDVYSRWQRCPYVPGNGFGEVTVNQAHPYPYFAPLEVR